MSRTEKNAAEEAANTASDIHIKAPKKARKGKITPLGRVLSFAGSFIMWAVILMCLVLVAPKLAGIKSYVVVSGSMEPSLPVGCLVYAKEVDPKTLEPGDVIVFYKSSNETGSNGASIPITHRVLENNKVNGEITTKGDANAQADLSPVTYNNVEGKVIYAMRRLGYLAAPLSSTIGKVAAFLIILSGYILSEVGSSMRKRS